MAVDVWADLSFKAGCVFESHATNTHFIPKTCSEHRTDSEGNRVTLG